MVAAGIIDPAKVTRSALENAASVSAMVLTTESLVADKPEPPHLLLPLTPAWAACTKRRRKALKLLDFLDAQKRIYACLTPLTPKIQAHDRVTEIGTCLKSRCRFFCLPGKYPILKNSMSVRQLGAIGRKAREHFQTVTDGGQHRLQILLSRLGGAGEV